MMLSHCKRRMNKLLHMAWICFVLAFFLNIADLVTTSMLLKVGGVEMNPLFSHFNTVGITYLDVVYKVSFPILFFDAYLCSMIYADRALRDPKRTKTEKWLLNVLKYFITMCGVYFVAFGILVTIMNLNYYLRLAGL